jgi:uncharacterized protein (AIM24 family)
MASFEIMEGEGMHWVKATLHGDALRAESGALSYLDGDIAVEAPLPSFKQMLAATLADEALIRPRYQGTGEVFLEAALGNFHVVELKDEEMILESGSYWASDGDIELSAYREPAWTSLWTGEGLLKFSTRVRGTGKVVMRVPGPVEEVKLSDGLYRTEGKIVVGRSRGLKYTVRRPTRSIFGYMLAGEGFLKSFEGTGRLLVCYTPYWMLRLQEMIRKD